MLLSPPLPFFGGAALGGFAFPLFSGVVLLSPLVWCCLLIPLVGGAFCSWADFSTLPFGAAWFLPLPCGWCSFLRSLAVVLLLFRVSSGGAAFSSSLLSSASSGGSSLKADLKLNSTMQQHVTKSNYSTIILKFSKFKAKWWFAILQVG